MTFCAFGAKSEIIGYSEKCFEQQLNTDFSSLELQAKVCQRFMVYCVILNVTAKNRANKFLNNEKLFDC